MKKAKAVEKARELLRVLLAGLARARRRAEEYIEKRDFSPREIRAVKAGAAVVGLFLVFSLYRAVSPDGSGVRGELELLRAQVREAKAIGEEYRYSSDLLRRVGSLREEKEALISVAEKALLGNQIDRNSFSIRGTNPSKKSGIVEGERVVVVQVSSVPLASLIGVLHSFQQSASVLRVSDLTIKTRFDNPSLTDATFRLSTFSFKDAG